MDNRRHHDGEQGRDMDNHRLDANNLCWEEPHERLDMDNRRQGVSDHRWEEPHERLDMDNRRWDLESRGFGRMNRRLYEHGRRTRRNYQRSKGLFPDRAYIYKIISYLLQIL